MRFSGDSLEPNAEIEEFSKLISQPGVVLLDIRTAQEFNDGFIENAQNIDFYNEQFANEINSLDKEKVYALYCRSGHRSGLALKMMKENGFQSVCHLDGGIINWAESGKAISFK